MQPSLSWESPSVRKQLAVTSLLVYIVMITANCLSIFLPLNGKTQAQLSAQYPNLFTPAGFTFSVWSVIYMFLLGFVIYQFSVLFKTHHKDRKRVVSVLRLFINVCLCNACWLFAWHYEMTTLSVFIMLIHLYLLVLINERLALSLPWRPLSSKLWIDIPFSIYLGWICVATIANIAAWLVSKGIYLSVITQQAWTIIMIAAALFVGIFYALTRNNGLIALTITWALYGIISKRKEAGGDGTQAIIITAEVSIAILLLIVLFNTVRKRRTDYKPDMSA